VPILLSRLTQATGTSCLQRWTRRCWLGNHPLDSWYDFSLGRAVTDLQAESRFDVVIVEYVIWSRALELFAPPTVRILDTHDVFTDRWKLMLQSSHCPRFWPWGSVSLSAEEERRGLDRADVVLAVQAEEARRLRTLTSRPVATVGHFTRITARPETSPDPTLVFVGSRWGPNVEGMRAFVTRVFPQIRKRVPQAALRVAGQVAGLVPAAPGVHRAGFLADSEALYRRAALAINPVPSGTGLAIKSIEALGHGCPLVTYAAGARGLSEAVGRGVLVAGSEQEFVDHVCRLLESPEEQSKRSRMALESAKEWNARQLAELIPLTEPRTPPSFRPPCRPRPAG
jgi:glycosyltransferase involved in cell wall biosynthesis